MYALLTANFEVDCICGFREHVDFFFQKWRKNNIKFQFFMKHDWLIIIMIDWLIDYLTDWLIDHDYDWLITWLIDWLISWLVGWLVGWLNTLDRVNWNSEKETKKILDRIINTSDGYMIDWLIDWSWSWLIDWLIDWFIDWLID